MKVKKRRFIIIIAVIFFVAAAVLWWNFFHLNKWEKTANEYIAQLDEIAYDEGVQNPDYAVIDCEIFQPSSDDGLSAKEDAYGCYILLDTYAKQGPLHTYLYYDRQTGEFSISQVRSDEAEKAELKTIGKVRPKKVNHWSADRAERWKSRIN